MDSKHILHYCYSTLYIYIYIYLECIHEIHLMNIITFSFSSIIALVQCNILTLLLKNTFKRNNSHRLWLFYIHDNGCLCLLLYSLSTIIVDK